MKLGNWTLFHSKNIIFGDLVAKQFIIVEHKDYFGLLFFYFKGKRQDRFHTHAFNAVSFKLWGTYVEHLLDSEVTEACHKQVRDYVFRYFSRDTYHSINESEGCATFVIQGPWKGTWKEWKEGVVTIYSPSRKIVRTYKVG